MEISKWWRAEHVGMPVVGCSPACYWEEMLCENWPQSLTVAQMECGGRPKDVVWSLLTRDIWLAVLGSSVQVKDVTAVSTASVMVQRLHLQFLYPPSGLKTTVDWNCLYKNHICTKCVQNSSSLVSKQRSNNYLYNIRYYKSSVADLLDLEG